MNVERDETGALVVRLEKEFTFNFREKFRKAYIDNPAGTRYVLDFGRVTYIDSSALGMLLLMHEHNGGGNTEIKLTNIQDRVRKILQVANFDRLFAIS
ncbi:MAG: STAS domain-containing protein [Magnetococcales bacterium]|nr:STAS domain-containing protein [Magnetococcales bacterium]